MLRTTAITHFFNANTSPHLDTLLLTTPSGKLLSLSSPLPVSALRTQATLASQLWSSYTQVARSSLLQASLPNASSSSVANQSRSTGQMLKCITIQLEHGTMVIRQLRCSLLFIVVGPSPPQRPQTAASITSTNTTAVNSSRNITPTPYHTHHPTDPQSSAPPDHTIDGLLAGIGDRVGGSSIRTTDTRPTSSMGIATSMVILQRHAEELGNWLDGELANFELTAA